MSLTWEENAISRKSLEDARRKNEVIISAEKELFALVYEEHNFRYELCYNNINPHLVFQIMSLMRPRAQLGAKKGAALRGPPRGQSLG